MLAMNLVDSLDTSTNYGILICNNEVITTELIQNKIHEIKDELDANGEEWTVDDIIQFFPGEWFVFFQKQNRKVEI